MEGRGFERSSSSRVAGVAMLFRFLGFEGELALLVDPTRPPAEIVGNLAIC